MFELDQLLRENIKQLTPYSSARDEYQGEEAVFLDANENPYNTPYNRYPDPYHHKLKEEISKLKAVDSTNIFLGNGSDEAIDLIIRAFCEPAMDQIITIDPTYGMYQVAAAINNVSVKKVPLTADFQLPVDALLNQADQDSRVMILCSPNNPTSNCFKHEDMERIIREFNGIVVIDEAYIDFSPEKTILPKLSKYPNLIVLQTFSKAWGLAGIRLGMAFAVKEIIDVLNKIKYPYNVNILTAQKALERIQKKEEKEKWVETILQDRQNLRIALNELPVVEKVYPSDANFILIRVKDARSVYQYLVEKNIVVRDRSKVTQCENCLRVTVGTEAENMLLISALRDYALN